MKRINKRKVLKYIKITVFILLIADIIINAWLCDDAFISFRVIKNFADGYGLRWNIFERVQPFTNPLMVLTLIPFYFITHEIYYTSIIFSIIASCIAIYLLLFKIPKNDVVSILIAIFLLTSKSFISFTTSGLENCLTFLLLAIFCYLFFKNKSYNKRNILLLSFVSSLILLNRMDAILLVLPSLVYVFKKRKKCNGRSCLLYFFIGLIPFIIWELFSLLYYGFLFPNTYYAKLNTGIPKIDYITNGLIYLKTVLMMDPSTILLIILGFVLLFHKKDKKVLCLLIGCIISILYIIYVGGDFMLGRFLTPSLFVIMICFTRLDNKDINSKLFKVSIVLFLIIYTLLYINYQKNISDLDLFETNKVADERDVYFKYTSLKGFTNSEEKINKMKIFTPRKVIDKLYLAGNTGFTGYFMDNDITIIDYYALSDPLLSRLPRRNAKLNRIGHNTRVIPDGYLESIEAKQNKIKDKNIKEYYEIIKIITQDKLFSKKRIKTIINMNMGKYNYLINNYLNFK